MPRDGHGDARFLAHDKDRRWADLKDEHALTAAITQEPGLVLIGPGAACRRLAG